MISKVLFFMLLALPAFAQKKPAILWTEWYLYTVGGKPMGYFVETAEKFLGDNQISVSQNWVELEDGKTETYIGSVAEAGPGLKPVAFFTDRKAGARTYKIDGRAKGGKLSITYKPGKPAGPKRHKTVALSDRVFLSNFMPLALARHDPSKGELSFTAVVEDAKDGALDARPGKAEAFAVKKEIKGNTCRRYVVEISGIQAEWWVTAEGKLCEVTTPVAKAKLELTTEEEAKKALEP